LTEEPEAEIPVARKLVARYAARAGHAPVKEINGALPYDPYYHERHRTRQVLNLGDHNVPRVIADYSEKEKITAASLFAAGYNYSVSLDKWSLTDQAVDFIYAGDKAVNFEIPGTLGIIYNSGSWKLKKQQERAYPLFCGWEYLNAYERSAVLNFVAVDAQVLD